MKDSDNSVKGLLDLEGFLKTKRSLIVSTLTKIGNFELVDKFLSERIPLNKLNQEENLNNQLYMACFWGDKEAVKTLIKMHANVNHANIDTRWTPLHAATFNEHGMIVMMLLEQKADPMSLDYKGRTPLDFASASEMIWPHFAFLGYQRTPRQALVDLQVLETGVPNQSSFQRSNNFGPLGGDIFGNINQ